MLKMEKGLKKDLQNNENEPKEKNYRITLLLSCDNPKLINKAKSNTSSDAKKGKDNIDKKTSVSTEKMEDKSIGYIDQIARNLSITRSAFVTFCILYFCKMPMYAIRQFIFPYYKYYCKEFRKKTVDKKKLQKFTLSIPRTLYDEFNEVRTKLVKVKKEEEKTIPFGEYTESIMKRTNSQLLNAILTYMMEYDIIREIPYSNMLKRNRDMFKTNSEYDMLCRAFRYTLITYKVSLQNKKYDKAHEEKQLYRLYEDVINRYRKIGKAIADKPEYKNDLTRACNLTESERMEREGRRYE